MEVTKPYEFIGFGAMEVTKPYEFHTLALARGGSFSKIHRLPPQFPLDRSGWPLLWLPPGPGLKCRNAADASSVPRFGPEFSFSGYPVHLRVADDRKTQRYGITLKPSRFEGGLFGTAGCINNIVPEALPGPSCDLLLLLCFSDPGSA